MPTASERSSSSCPYCSTASDARTWRGSGNGAVLRKMRACGFTDLAGVDPFIAEDLTEAPGFNIRRGSIDDGVGEYDLVMFNHSLEHIPDQPAALRRAAKMLAPGGWILVRIPVVNETRRRYCVNWVKLDAPRHLAIPSPDGMIRLARGTGLALERVVYDAYDFELWRSEQYRMDIPLFGPDAQPARGARAFTRGQMIEFRRTIAEWNEGGLSGRARFYLRPNAS